jgi:hypothetical protein
MILHDVVIPSDVPEDLIPRALEDVLHEFAVPDRRIKKTADDSSGHCGGKKDRPVL